METDYLMEKKMEVQLDLFTQKLMNELKAIKDEIKGTQDQLRMLNKTISSSGPEASITSSHGARQDHQVPPRQAPSGSQYGTEGFSPQAYPQQAPAYGYQQGYPQPPQQPQFQQPQQAPHVQMDQNQGGFTGASVAQSSRGRGTNLPPGLSMDKVFYCGGKR